MEAILRFAASTMTSRRFPAPWRAGKVPGGYVGRDATEQVLACLYSRQNEAEADRRRYSRTTRRDGSPSTSRGWLSCSARLIATDSHHQRDSTLTSRSSNSLKLTSHR